MNKIFLLSISVLFFGCKDAKTVQTKNATTMETQNNQGLLQTELDERKASFEKKAPEDTKKAYAEGLKAVSDSNITSKALQVGDVAPNFTLKNATGDNISLYNELKKGPVVLL